MHYEGKRSHSTILMLIQVHRALDELNLDPVWREHGVICHFSVPRNGKTFIVRRMFFAEPGRLIETASLYDEPAAINSVEPQCLAGHATVSEALVADVTPRFVGRLLDESTAALLDAAGESRDACPPKT